MCENKLFQLAQCHFYKRSNVSSTKVHVDEFHFSSLNDMVTFLQKKKIILAHNVVIATKCLTRPFHFRSLSIITTNVHRDYFHIRSLNKIATKMLTDHCHFKIAH